VIKKISAIYINVGATKDISETQKLQRYIILKTCEVFKLDIPQINNLSDVQLRSIMSEILKSNTSSKHELYVIISEYDKLIDAQNTKWLPNYIKNVKWIISLSDESIAESMPSSTHKKAIYGISHLGDISFESQMKAYEKLSGKTIAAQVKTAINKLPYAGDYMMLEIIINRLMHFDGKDIPSGDTKELPYYMEQYVKNAPHDDGNSLFAIQYFLRGDFDKFDTGLCEFIFVCMAFFNRGLTISDIEKIAQLVGLSWSELDIIRFLNYEAFLLAQYEDGRYDISSGIISRSLVKLYHQKFKFEYGNAIFDYLKNLPDETSIKIDNFWFLCYLSNHFEEYLDYLNSLYGVGKDNKNLKMAFLPLFGNHEAIRWLLTSFKKEKLRYNSTEFVRELISIVANTFSDYSPKLTEEFIVSTQNIEDISGNFETSFRQHYTLTLDKIKGHDYQGFIEHFNLCLNLSKKQFEENPPLLKYLDEDVDHKYPIASLQQILETEYGFSFVEEMAALMSKYTDLPKEFQDESKVSYYANKAQKILARIGNVSYILPKDIGGVKKKDENSVYRKKPSWLRGKAIELSKQSDREENSEIKGKLLRDAIKILNEILSLPEDDLVGDFKDSQKAIEYESTIYMECHRDIALCYDRLSDIQENCEKFTSLDFAYNHISIYSKEYYNEQTLTDILRITRALIPIAPQFANKARCLQYCVSAYMSFAETTPRLNTMSFEERLYAEMLEDMILNEIKNITTQDVELRKQWIQECKNNINTFQTLGNIDAMVWLVYGFNRSLSYYVHELNMPEYVSGHIALMGSMLKKLEEYLHIGTITLIYENAKKCLNFPISDQDVISILHIEKMYSQYMLVKGDFDKSLEASQNVIDYCEKDKILVNDDDIPDVEYQALKLNSGIYLERNDIGKAWASIDKIADYAGRKFEQEKNLGNMLELANAKLNQVILWDKMSAEPGLGLWTIEHHKSYEAQKQLYDIYEQYINFEEKDEQLSKLMRRIRQSHEILMTKGLGYLATPKTLNLVKHFKSMVNDAVLLEKDGQHNECIKKFELLIKALHDTHFVDIYFEADWYASILFTLGQDAWSKELKDKTSDYYEEAIQIRYELEDERIGQNKENFALLLYFYALVILGRPLSQGSISQVIHLLNKSEQTFSEIENELGTDSLSYYASCCFNLGQLICLYTTGGNDAGLPLVRDAINISERLVNDFGLSSFQKDVDLFKQRYLALQNR
jgi:hypothetical protein